MPTTSLNLSTTALPINTPSTTSRIKDAKLGIPFSASKRFHQALGLANAEVSNSLNINHRDYEGLQGIKKCGRIDCNLKVRYTLFRGRGLRLKMGELKHQVHGKKSFSSISMCFEWL